MASKKKLTILVSSTVYGIEELLDRIYALLTAYGYEVWMSHKGTMPVSSDKTAFNNCLDAVEKCDLFLGLITPQYGSGQDPDDSAKMSITHQEIIRALELNKPRWILAHDHVVFARSLLNNLGYKGKKGRAKLHLKKTKVFEDLRVLDLYEDATLDKEPPDSIPLVERAGNWAQKFNTSDDAAVFVMAQFFRYQDVEAFIKENFKGGNPLEGKGTRS